MKSDQNLYEKAEPSSQPPITSSFSETPDQNPRSGTGLLAVIQSVLAAAFGVQSQKNRERDFKGGKFSHFIIAGIIFTFIFILVVYGAVQLALHQL